MHTLDVRGIAIGEKDVYDLIEALRSRATPEAHSAVVIPINHLAIKRWGSKLLRNYENELVKYNLEQLVPNLMSLRSDTNKDHVSVDSIFLFDAFPDAWSFEVRQRIP